MLKKELNTLLNNQINKEFYSSYIYLNISNYYYSVNLNGFGNWFKIQAQEELDHALLIMQYIQDNGEDVELDAISKPDKKFEDFISPLSIALDHECYITDSINNIYAEALNLKDFRTVQFLDWFVKEQCEEEKNVKDLLERFKLFGGEAKGLYMLDSELASRVYTAPSINAE